MLSFSKIVSPPFVQAVFSGFSRLVRAVGSLQFTAMVAVSRGVAPPTAHRAQTVSVAEQPNRQDFPQVPEVC